MYITGHGTDGPIPFQSLPMILIIFALKFMTQYGRQVEKSQININLYNSTIQSCVTRQRRQGGGGEEEVRARQQHL